MSIFSHKILFAFIFKLSLNFNFLVKQQLKKYFLETISKILNEYLIFVGCLIIYLSKSFRVIEPFESNSEFKFSSG